ncbi:TadE-like protein [compost metagenome]
MQTPRICTEARRQRGVYAIEFAMVFLIFFTLLYGIICYGMFFTFRLNVQNAAEDGARAALRYQSTLQNRQVHAETIAEQRVSWLPSNVPHEAEATLCGVESNVCGVQPCGPEWKDRCRMVVTVTASNMRGLLPPLPAFAVPDSIVGKASMLLDGRAP